MATLIQFLAYDWAILANFKSWGQGLGNAFSTFGWVPSTDGGNISNTGNYGTATITNIAITSNILAVTFSSPTNQFAPGQVVQLTCLTTNTFLNGQYVRITNQGAQGATSSTTGVGFPLTSVANASGGTTVYTGTITGGGTAPGFTGVTFTVAGFSNGANNGTWICTASTATTLTLANAAGVAETTAATATIVPDRTNTTFTASFVHANVGSGADTGTVTALYNWNTVQNIPDKNDTNTYAQNQPKKFRGNWVGATPTFTQLQTTSNATTLSFGANGHGLDLTRSVGLGLRITGITNAAFTWLNDANNPTSNTQTYPSGWIIASLTSTTIVILTGFSPRADIAATPVTNGFASPWYVGNNNTGTTSVNDVVLFGGDLYEELGGTAASAGQVNGGAYGFQGQGGGGTTNGVGTGATPGATTNVWKRVFYDVWTSNDALSSTNKLSVRLQYGANVGSNIAVLYLSFGTATDGSCNISQNYGWGTVVPTSSISTSGPTISGAAVWESEFSGASGRFAMLLWRGFNVQAASPCLVMNIERSKDSNGNDTDAYWTVVYSSAANACYQQCIFKPGTGGAGVLELNVIQAIKALPFVNAQSLNNSICVSPVFPIPGFVANPMLGVIAMKGGDANEGGLINVSFYGTQHPYFMSKVGNTQAGGPAAFGPSTAGSTACGIRWE
jgi:hypothetical protein